MYAHTATSTTRYINRKNVGWNPLSGKTNELYTGCTDVKVEKCISQIQGDINVVCMFYKAIVVG